MRIYLTFFLILFSAKNLIGQEGFTTKTVTVFKNNSGFFSKEGKISPKNNHHVFDLETMPKSAYGTFWLSGENLLHLTSYQKETVSIKNTQIDHIPNGNRNFLKINKGKRAKIFLRGGKTFQGVIKETSNSLVFMALENSDFLSMPISEIHYITLLEKSNGFNTTSRSDTTKTKKQIVNLQFKNNNQQDLELIYFQNGIGWTPSYKIELQKKSEAKITMQATLSNQVEGLKNVDINFVVGYPNIKYASTLDILFNNANIAEAFNQNAQNNYIQFTDRSIRGIGKVYTDANFTTGTSTNSTINNLSIEGVAEEDLYFYNLKDISLPKGGIGYFSIFETTVPYKDLYEVNLTPNHNHNYGYQSVDYKDEYRNKVWHILMLENTSKHAWTSGAAMVVKRDEDVVFPISQDDLNYTPIQGKGKLKLTISPDVSVKDYEEEKNRTTRQQEKDGYYYEVITVSGEIKIQNFKSEDINLNIKKTIVGNLSESNPDWLKAIRVNTYTSLNKTNEVCWEIQLKARESKVVEYEYNVYVRR